MVTHRNRRNRRIRRSNPLFVWLFVVLMFLSTMIQPVLAI